VADMTIAGKKVPKWAVYGGVGVAVVGGVLWYKNRRSSSSSSSNASGTDPVTGLPYSMDNQLDPATGMTYLAEAQQYGSVSAAEAAVSAGYGGVSGGTSGYSGEGYGYPTYTTTGTSTTTGVSYPDNASWAQAAEAGLTALGYSSTDVAAAIGRYLGKLSLTADQATIVEAAIAEYGNPPVGSFQIIQQGSGSGPTTTGSTGRLPNVTGLHVSGLYTNSAQVSWNAVSGATGYTAQLKQGGDNGPTASGPFAVSKTVANFGGLKPKTKYTAMIWPGDGQNVSQPHAEISFTTK
jgi:hypothetical protein